MKYKLSKIVLMLLLVLGVSMSLFLGNSKAADINTSKIDNCEKKVASVKVTDAKKYLSEGSHPTLSGYLFAGWYTTSNIPADLEQAKQLVIRNAAGIPAEADNVYALFVPEHVLSVKAQVSAHLIDGVDDSKDGNASIRFVTTVDSLLYRAVGFEVTYSVAGEEKHSNSEKNTVYEYLYVTGTEDAKQVWGETPYSSFCGVSKYFRAHTISGVPSGYYDTEFHVKPYWITLSGDKIYGIEDTKTIKEGCSATVSVRDSTNGQIQSDKTSYKLGDTVTLTGNANEGYYFKALKVNGTEVSFSSNNTYTFTATEKNYTVEGTFGKRFFRDTDNTNWYVLKQDEGVVTLPNGGSGGRLYLYDEYTNIDLNMTVKDDPDVTTNGRTTVWFEFDNGQTANFSVIETGTKSMIQMMPCTVNNNGWNGVYNEFTATERTDFNSDKGVDFRIVREGTVFRFYIDWVLRATMDLSDYIKADTSANVAIHHEGDANVPIDIPFRVSHGVDNVTLDITSNGDGTIATDKETYMVGDTITLYGEDAYYCSAMKVNGKEVTLDRNGKYSFIAKDSHYTIEATTAKRFFKDTDNENWNLLKQGEGVVTLPNGGSGGRLYLYDDYTNVDLTLTAKDHPDVAGETRTTVWFEFEGGETINFAVYTNNDRASMIQMTPSTITGTESWSAPYKFDTDETAKFQSTNGIDFRVVKDGTRFYLYLDGVKRHELDLANYDTAQNITAETPAKVAIHHDKDEGVSIDIPFSVSHSTNNVVLYIKSNGDGEIVADKASYVVGDTINLYGKDAYYCTAMTVNGNAVTLDGQGKYSFNATDRSYVIEATTAKRVFAETTNSNWNVLKQNEGVVTLPNGGSGGRLYFIDDYTNIDLTLTAKDHPDVAGETRTTVWFEFEGGETINFAVYTNTNGASMIQMMPSTITGDGSWSAPYKFDIDETAKFQSTNGIDFRVVKDGTRFYLYLDGVKRHELDLANYDTAQNITAETPAKVAIHHEHDEGVQIDIPFTFSYEIPSYQGELAEGETVSAYNQELFYINKKKRMVQIPLCLITQV